LYTADPCLKQTAVDAITAWVRRGGHLFGSAAAGSRNEFNEPVDGLAPVFGIANSVTATVQSGRYHIRGALNELPYLDQIAIQRDPDVKLGVLGTKITITSTTGQVAGTFQDGTSAVVENQFGQGRATYFAACPAIAYVKEAKFVPDALREKWPADIRSLINGPARQRGAKRLVELSHAVVEAGVYDATSGTALVLANFAYDPIRELRIRLSVPRPVNRVRSLERGPLPFSAEKASGDAGGGEVSCVLDLGISDIVLFE
jgi:hypothetical protein